MKAQGRVSVWTMVERLTTLLVLVAAVIVGWRFAFPNKAPQQRPEIKLPDGPVSVQEATIRGEPNAPITMLIFSDFQCPFCATFAKETWPVLAENEVKQGRLRVAFRHLPLSMHPRAPRAAAAVECAGEQGRFWEMHDLLFAETKLLDDDLTLAAKSLGLMEGPFRGCLDGPVRDKVARDANVARSLGISGTPAFLIGRTLPGDQMKVTAILTGARPLSEFRSAFDRTLAAR